jgi:uncharacterized membrane protein YdbT with pleckstrin-like domain
MRYVDQVLQPDEKIVQVTSISRVGYFRGIALLVVALVLWYLRGIADLPGIKLAGAIAAFLLIAIGLYLIGLTWWRRFTTEVAVTDRRVIYAVGFVNRHTVEMNMDKIESVDVEQWLSAQLLNYGDIVIHGTGETCEVLREIDDPLHFRSHITAA